MNEKLNLAKARFIEHQIRDNEVNSVLDIMFRDLLGGDKDNPTFVVSAGTIQKYLKGAYERGFDFGYTCAKWDFDRGTVRDTTLYHDKRGGNE